MDQSVKAYLMTQGLYEFTLGGYPSRDSSNNVYNVFYGIKQKIGSGGFGVVHIADRYLAKSDGIRKDPTWPECAVKVLTMPTGSGQRFNEMSDRIRQELAFNNNDRLHEKKNVVVPIRVHVAKDEAPLIVMEYCSGGDLAKYLTRCNQRRLSERLAKRIISQVCLGLLEIRDEGFFHRDVKLANVFITNKTTDEAKMKFKIGDFGLVAKTREENRILCGTPANLAPEITGKNIYGPEVDVWSLGVLLYTILIGQVPFRGDNDVDTIRRAREELHVFPQNCQISYEAKDLINRMLQKDPRARIPLEDILKHSFISECPSKTTMSSLQSSVFSNDSGFSSSNASGSVGSSPALRNSNFKPGQLKAVLETDPCLAFNRRDFSRNFQSTPNSGPIVASVRLEGELFARSQSYSHSSFEFRQNQNINSSNNHLNRYASSAPSLATNLSSTSFGPPQSSNPNSISNRQGTSTLAPPLSTRRLRPSTKKHHFRIGSGMIEEDGKVRLEFNIPKKVNEFRTDNVIETIIISSDGADIQVSRSNSPEFGVRGWRYEELPTKYWSKYNYAAKFVNLVRESTPKITVYTDDAVYRLMENGPPEANFEVQYNTGEKFCYSVSKGVWTSSTSGWTDPSHHPEFRSWTVERDRIRHLEKMMEDLEREEELKRLPGKRYMKFPLVMGKRTSSLSSLPKVQKPSSQIFSQPNSPAKFQY